MLLNANTELIGQNIVLVPYDEDLVPKYHEWMTSPELLEATASEALTLEEEYEMQKTWRNDENKLTFIIVDKSKYESHEKRISAMVGDVNLFLNPDGAAEVSLMVAENSYRRRGFGKEALALILQYGKSKIPSIKWYEAKIGRSNTASVKLFETFKFFKSAESQIFDEFSYSSPLLDDSQWLNDIASMFPYHLRERPSN